MTVMCAISYVITHDWMVATNYYYTINTYIGELTCATFKENHPNIRANGFATGPNGTPRRSLIVGNVPLRRGANPDRPFATFAVTALDASS